VCVGGAGMRECKVGQMQKNKTEANNKTAHIAYTPLLTSMGTLLFFAALIRSANCRLATGSLLPPCFTAIMIFFP
jgi:hypothetical protein